ncbi:hypothetical protein [Deminuibacter soli]|uniref:Uncharacterized protein n=1 Tax=Deminuibacter soli TaxID=2291815 RepID=A0A3E1NQF2_9BACT|nr:hypothetical protein [Deminuibacter soli]RFM30044.1 hypothetical protein DXN05_03470 [Deminuibacter soli]
MQAPKHYAIAFIVELVKAILAGLKTQTRRVLLKQPSSTATFVRYDTIGQALFSDGTVVPFPFGRIGSVLWVREEHFRYGHWEPVKDVLTNTGKQKWEFVGDTEEVRFDTAGMAFPIFTARSKSNPTKPYWHKRLARFMFRKHARVFLRVTGYSVERLQDISEADAKAEGVLRISAGGFGRSGEEWKNYRNIMPLRTAKQSFQSLWESINGVDSWAANPWVWVIEFDR